MTSKRLTVASATDVAGQTYGPGDVVAVSILSWGKRPQTVVGEVVSINASKADGTPYPAGEVTVSVEPIMRSGTRGRGPGRDSGPSRDYGPDRVAKLSTTVDAVRAYLDRKG